MHYSSRTDRAFDALRQAPVEIPLEKIEQFVIASAATGAFSIAVASKFAFKFSMNTIIAMCSAAAATTIAGIVFLVSPGHSAKAENKSPARPEQQSVSPLPKENAPELSAYQPVLPVDSPEVNVAAAAPGQNQSGNTADGNSTCTPGQTQVTITEPASDSSPAQVYSYNYSNGSSCATAKSPVWYLNLPVNEKTKDNGSPYTACSVTGPGPALEAAVPSCSPYSGHIVDSLHSLLENTLVKDGLITDRDHYSFRIDGNSMSVNGKKQPKETWQKYKDLFENNSKNHVNRHFRYYLKVNGKDCSLEVANYET